MKVIIVPLPKNQNLDASRFQIKHVIKKFGSKETHKPLEERSN